MKETEVATSARQDKTNEKMSHFCLRHKRTVKVRKRSFAFSFMATTTGTNNYIFLKYYQHV